MIHFYFTVQAVKKRWTSLRDCYRKALNRKKTVSGQKAVNVVPWKYEQQMGFLKTYVCQKRSQTTNLDSIEDQNENVDATTSSTGISEVITAQDFEEDDDEFSTSDITLPDKRKTASMARPSKKKKCDPQTSAYDMLSTYLASKKSSSDHIAAYFKMVETTVRTFSPLQQVEIKARFSSILSEYEYKNLSSASSHHSSPSPNLSSCSSVCVPSPSYYGPTNYQPQLPSLPDHGFPPIQIMPQDMSGNNPSTSSALPESAQHTYIHM